MAGGGAETLWLTAKGWSNADLPVLIYRRRVSAGEPERIEATLAGNGWRPEWRDEVFPLHHFHSTAHEALACTSGSAKLTLDGPKGRTVAIEAGDLLVLPVGTGHRQEQASQDFLLVGAYPDGQRWDVCRAAADDAANRRIAAVPLPTGDPLDGPGGELVKHWSMA